MALLEPLDQFTFHHVLQSTSGPCLVVFTSEGCGACRHLKQVLGAGGDALADVRLFEVDARRDMALTHEFEVVHLPALFLFCDGQFHAALHAVPTPAGLRKAVDSALDRPPAEAP